MSGQWFTDIRHFPDPLRDSGINREARQLRDYLGRIISAATAALTERAFESSVPCRLPGRKGCSGHLLVERLDEPGEIHWACPVCQKSGVITGWQKSCWDLSAERELVKATPEEEWLRIRVSLKTFKALNEISYLDRETERILVSGMWNRDGVVLLGSADDFDELLNFAAAESNHAPSSRDRRRMSEAMREIAGQLSGEREKGPIFSGDRIPEEIRSIASRLIESGNFSTLDDLNRALSAEMERYNQRPRKELGGLSPSSLHQLLHCNWNRESALIRLNDSLRSEDLKGSELLCHSRIFLDALERWKEVPATVAGNLPRKFVSEMFDRFPLDDSHREVMRSVNKVLNEGDFFRLHLVRVLCDFAGLSYKRKQKFRITRKGKALLREEQAGHLFVQLFDTHFGKLNLAYLNPFGPDAPGLQVSVPYTLYRMSRLPKGPQEVSRIVSDLVIPAVNQECDSQHLPSILRWRVLQPLQSFGLVQLSENNGRIYVQRLPLFERFFEFRI